MIYAWLAFETGDDDACHGCCVTCGVQRMIVAEHRRGIIEQANAVLAAMGASGGHFDPNVWDYPYSIDIGAGIDAILYPCDAEGVNYACGREPTAE